jgi:ribosomal protein L12E/L44/L45/RPP1/RPP2
MTDVSNSPRHRTGWRLLTRWQLLTIVVALLLFAGWRAGTFDRVLSNVGLQAHECRRNGLGATFCGKELDEYRERISRIKQAGVEATKQAEATSKENREKSEFDAAWEKGKAEARERQTLESKLKEEKAIVEREPEGSVANGLARMEYESARAQLQQLRIR